MSVSKNFLDEILQDTDETLWLLFRFGLEWPL